MSRSERNQISRRVLLAGAGAAAGATLTAGVPVRAATEPAAFGPVKIRPGDPRYNGLLRGNNFRHVGRPDEIRVVGSTDQVVRAVTEAVRAGRRVAVRSGGHCFENFTTDPAVRVLLDLSSMFDQNLMVNAKGPYFTIQKLAPFMAEGSGIVLTTTIANALGLPMFSTYAASKAALRSMTRSLARELLPRKIRVNAVSPGATDSGALERVLPPEMVDQAVAQFIAATPMQRMGTPAEVVKAMLFLAFDATYTTGAELVVDGGTTQL